MPTTTLTPTVTSTFPSGATYTLDQFANAFAARLSFTIPSASVLWGQLGGSEPLAALPGNGSTGGLWFNNNTLFAWNTGSSKYLPLPVIGGQIVSGTIYTTEFQCANLSSNTTVMAPADKSGTIALTSDIVSFIGTQTLSGTTVNVDWTKKQNAYIVMSGNTTITHSGYVDGQTQDVWVENPTSSAYTVTWSGVNTGSWPASSVPVQTVGSASHRKIDHYRFHYQAATIFGKAVDQNYDIPTSGAGSDTTPPSVVSIDGVGNSAVIYITMSEGLQAATLSNGGFTVKKGGVTQTMSTAVSSGSFVTLTITATYKSTNSLTVQYSGTDIKDIAGNQAAAFGPSAVVISSGGGGGGGDGRNTGQ